MTKRSWHGDPTVEVLYFDGCPNHERTAVLIGQALTAEKIAAPIQMVRVETEAEAYQQRFYGSPTVRINGEDIAPPPENATPGFACRVYRTPDGRLSPTPAYETIVAALRHAAAG